MPDEIKGTDAVSASPDADSLFYLLKITERGEIGNRDPDGSVKEFFDIDDIGVIQSTALLQDFNADEFIEIPGQVNDKWVNGDGSWGGLNGLSLLVPESPLGGGIMMPKLEATWTAGATDADTELNAALAIKTAYEGLNVESSTFPTVGFVAADLFTYTDGNTAFGLTPGVMWATYGSQIKNLLKSSIPDLTSASKASHIITVLDQIIGGKSFTFQPGSNFKFVDTSSSNVIEALNNFYGPNTSIQKDLVNDPTSLKDFSTVKGFVQTQIDRTTNFFGNVFNSPTFWNEYKALTNTTNLTTGVAQNFLLIQQITGQLSTGLSFTGLSDTPTNYDDGKILQSTTTGLKWVDMPAGGGVDSVDDITDLPDNPADGQLVTVGCDLHIGCNGEWVKVGAGAVAPPSEAPACVSNLEEFNQYTEYKDQFLADNTSTSFSAGLNNQTNIHDFVHDVCLFADSNLNQERNTVVIDETTFKWGMFAGDQNINIRAQGFSSSNIGSCTFKEWRSDLPNFPKTNAQETVFIDRDSSITGYFECTFAPDQPNCNQVALHLQPAAGETIADKSDNQHTVTTVGDTVVDTTAILFGRGTMNFDGAGDYLQINQTNLLNLGGNFTMECWFKLNAEQWTNKGEMLIASWPDISTDIGSEKWQVVRINSQNNTLADRQKIKFQSFSNTGSINISSNDLMQLNAWHHVAIVASGDVISMYINGKLQNSATGWSDVTYTQLHPMHIGTRAMPRTDINQPYHANMHAQDFRISKKAVYTGNFTPPTSLLGNPCDFPGDQPTCSEVDFHLQASSGGTVEDKSDNNLSITNSNNVNNQSFIDNSETLFGESTFFFDNNKLLEFTPPNFGSDDFTIELWIKYDTAVTASTKNIITKRGLSANSGTEYSISLNQDRIMFVNSLGVYFTSTGIASVVNNWTHIAAVRIGNSFHLYVNGQREVDDTMNGSVVSSVRQAEIGDQTASGWTSNPKHIQDFRISKKAVYTSNFVPAAALLDNPC